MTSIFIASFITSDLLPPSLFRADKQKPVDDQTAAHLSALRFIASASPTLLLSRGPQFRSAHIV